MSKNCCVRPLHAGGIGEPAECVLGFGTSDVGTAKARRRACVPCSLQFSLRVFFGNSHRGYFSATSIGQIEVKQSVPCRPARGFRPPACPWERPLGGRVRRCAVPYLSSSAVTVIWADGAAIVTVRGELDPLAWSRVRERIAAVIGQGPQ